MFKGRWFRGRLLSVPSFNKDFPASPLDRFRGRLLAKPSGHARRRTHQVSRFRGRLLAKLSRCVQSTVLAFGAGVVQRPSLVHTTALGRTPMFKERRFRGRLLSVPSFNKDFPASLLDRFRGRLLAKSSGVLLRVRQVRAVDMAFMAFVSTTL